MTAPFDAVALRYSELWSETAAGRLQREAVWRAIDPLFAPGSRVLDLGCGIGDDAVHLGARGVRVTGIDESAAMVGAARERGVDAHVIRIEDAGQVRGPFDGVLSNFGALNCVECLDSVAEDLARLVVPGGSLALCVLGKRCAWETACYAARGDWPRASRRWRAESWSQSLGVRVYYPDTREIVRAFGASFRLKGRIGIGVAVPPSYVKLTQGTVERLAACDRAIARWPLMRAMGDHRLYLFERL
jgi:SAM-dependent methyltransferase